MERLSLRAHYVTNSLNLAKIEAKNKDLPLYRRERNLLMYRLSDTQFICVYGFGAVVLCGIEERKEVNRYLRLFGKALEGEGRLDGAEKDDVEPEHYDVVIDPDAPEEVGFDVIRLKNLDRDKLLLVFHVAAQSVALDYLERKIDAAVRKFERPNRELAERGRLVIREQEVMRTIGMSGNVINFIIDKLALLDKPDITWEDKDAETMYSNLRKTFEVDDRFSAIKFKIEFLQDTSELMLDVLENRKSNYLEIVIIVLIALEFVFFVFTGIG